MVDVLSCLVSLHGAPLFLRSDNGPLSDPGKPWQNGADESFNGKFRDECLSLEWLRSRREVTVVIEAWRRHYTAVRPHSSLNYMTRHEFKQHNPVHLNRVVLQE